MYSTICNTLFNTAFVRNLWNKATKGMETIIPKRVGKTGISNKAGSNIKK